MASNKKQGFFFFFIIIAYGTEKSFLFFFFKGVGFGVCFKWQFSWTAFSSHIVSVLAHVIFLTPKGLYLVEAELRSH